MISSTRFIAEWTRATFLGWTLGFCLLLLFIGLSAMVGLGNTQFPIGLGMGIGVGALQRKLIANRIGAGASWWRSTIIGVTAPFLVWDVLRLLMRGVPHAVAASVVAGGLVVGILQWRVLRMNSSRGIWWIPCSVLGWSLAASLVVLNDRVMPRIPGLVGALIYIAVILFGGVLLGLVTGPTLSRILTPPAAT